MGSSSEIELRGFGRGGSRGELSKRSSRELRAVQEGGTLDLARLAGESDYTELRAMFRKRITEDGMRDIADVTQVAVQLAAGDQFLATLLIPIVQEYGRQTAQDIRNFGR
ncbi:hypothetical protein [Streptomyces sp. MBT53]|uniref:hypothetical protein n=1 Tax=Streptomyces sp. MBT53 TaxID=1488384 RepID=UPI001913C9C2|nr:hypothetical protein [Streptomyces sp. MBT53]MBK6017009.1 hypothetical protein [Streptomyces sp. MBT53]